jgi:hypothetical protein
MTRRIEELTIEQIAVGTARNGSRYGRVTDDRGRVLFVWNSTLDKLAEGRRYKAAVDDAGDRLRIVEVEPLPAPASAAPAAPAPAPVPATVPADKDELIVRQTCVKAACELFAGSGDVEGALRAAQALLAWVLGQEV